MINKIRKNDIAITGIALRLPQASSLDEFEKILCGKKCCIDEIPQERIDLVKEYHEKLGMEDKATFSKAAYLKGIEYFDNVFFGLSPLEAILMDPNQRIFLETAIDAIEDAGLGCDKIRGTQTGVFFAYSNQTKYLDMIKELSPNMDSLGVLGSLPPFAPGRLAHKLDLRGPNLVINTLCSSSLTAIHYACKSLIQQECQIAIVGGTRIEVDPILRNRIGIESKSGYTKAFTDNSDGTGGGEGSIVIVLKSLANAINGNDNIYAVIKGSAVNHDGRSSSLTKPNPEMQKEVIIKAWENAGIDPRKIGYVEAHGTGTKLGDPIEIQGLSKAFQNYTKEKQFCAVGSVKTNYGHLDCVAGLLGVLKGVLSVNRKKLYPQLFFDKPNRYIDFESSPVYVNTDLKDWELADELRICGVSSFSFSGSNCHLVIQEAAKNNYSDKKCETDRYLITLSADSEESLINHVKNYKNFILKNSSVNLNDLCYSANIRNAGYKSRLAIWFNDYEELINIFNSLEKSWEDKVCVKANKKIMMSDDLSIASENDYEEQHHNIMVNETYQIACKYIRGENIQWKNICPTSGNNISVPLYPFNKNKLWVTMIPQ